MIKKLLQAIHRVVEYLTKETHILYLLLIGVTVTAFLFWSKNLLSSLNPGPNTREVLILKDSVLIDTVQIYDYSQFQFVESDRGLNLNKDNNLLLNLRPKLLLLIFMLAFVFSISLSLSIALGIKLYMLYKRYNISIGTFMLSMVTTGLMLYVFIYLPYQTELLTSFTTFIDKTNLFIRDSSVVFESIYPLYALIIIGGISLLSYYAILRPGKTNDLDHTGLISLYMEARRNTLVLLGVMGIFVSSSVVFTSWVFGEAFRESIIGELPAMFDIFPYDMMLIQAIVLTIFIVLMYIPILFFQHSIRVKIFSFLSYEIGDGEKWLQSYTALNSKLRSEESFLHDMSTSIALISPLLAYFLTKIFV
ncbi:hypothetical protein [Lewinella sp. LCG006]|uniref:hypothetical protein n=1 Tax=Lewinella sp. LCG006 TaxID=3231911 RepID=UPI00345FD744